MEFVSFRISGKGFTVFKISPLTAERIIKSMSKTDVDGVKNTPLCIESMLRGIAYALAESSMFSGIKAYFIYRKLKRGASFEELFDAYQKIISMIPLGDLADVAIVFKKFSTLISKDNV